jgi:hypothetical protein
MRRFVIMLWILSYRLAPVFHQEVIQVFPGAVRISFGPFEFAQSAWTLQ